MEFVSPFARHAKRALVTAVVVAGLSFVASGISYALENNLYAFAKEANYQIYGKFR